MKKKLWVLVPGWGDAYKWVKKLDQVSTPEITWSNFLGRRSFSLSISPFFDQNLKFFLNKPSNFRVVLRRDFSTPTAPKVGLG